MIAFSNAMRVWCAIIFAPIWISNENRPVFLKTTMSLARLALFCELSVRLRNEVANLTNGPDDHLE
jgi:hypothetical protein